MAWRCEGIGEWTWEEGNIIDRHPNYYFFAKVDTYYQHELVLNRCEEYLEDETLGSKRATHIEQMINIAKEKQIESLVAIKNYLNVRTQYLFMLWQK